MDLSDTFPTIRHDGWTAERRVRFLDRLAQDGNVLASCALVGLSREAAYRLKRRDPLFARAWAAAQALGREASAEVLGTRAIEGIEEEIWYRGEVVGTHRRYDNRLLLAHVARLDKVAEANPGAQADAARFDELLACVAGVRLPDELARCGEDLPATRLEHVKAACDDAERVAQQAADELERARFEAGAETWGEADDPEWDELEAEAEAAWNRAHDEAATEWDAWFDDACATVDRALRTLSPLSTSSRAGAPLDEARQPPE